MMMKMTKRAGWLACLILLCSALQPLHAQQAPDNEAIHQAIMNPESPYYYPNLFGRYMAGDRTLTAEDYRYLYYGYVWQDSYKPFETSPASDRILMIFEATPEPDAEGMYRIIQYATEVMRTEPFNPSNINFLTYAYGALGDTVNERINHDRLQMVVSTIKSTGTGVSEESPWHVIAFSHAKDVMVMMGLQTRKPMIVSRTVEYFPLVMRQEKVRGYYFNYERVYWFKPDAQPERERSWEFNGMPLNRR